MGFEEYPVPDEIHFLCLLHNIGATSCDRSLSLEQISRWAAMDAENVRENLEKLIRNSYVSVTGGKYYVTIEGIRKVLSMYS